MEESNKFDLKFILKCIGIAVISIKILFLFYGLTFGAYFKKSEQNNSQTALLNELISSYSNVSDAYFDRGNLEITVDVTHKVSEKELKSSISNFICAKFSTSKDVLNINMRYSHHYKYPKSGNLLASWLLFAKKCT